MLSINLNHVIGHLSSMRHVFVSEWLYLQNVLHQKIAYMFVTQELNEFPHVRFVMF